MKRIALLLTSFALLTGFMTGCGNKNAFEATETATVIMMPVHSTMTVTLNIEPSQEITTTPEATATREMTATTEATKEATVVPAWRVDAPLTPEGKYDFTEFDRVPYISFDDVTSGRWAAYVTNQFGSQLPDPSTVCDIPWNTYKASAGTSTGLNYNEAPPCPVEQQPVVVLGAAKIRDEGFSKWGHEFMVVTEAVIQNGNWTLVNAMFPSALLAPNSPWRSKLDAFTTNNYGLFFSHPNGVAAFSKDEYFRLIALGLYDEEVMDQQWDAFVEGRSTFDLSRVFLVGNSATRQTR